MKKTKIKNVLLVFSSSELGGAERSLTRMALVSSPNVYQLATLDGEGPWCDWVRSQGLQPLVFGVRRGALHGTLRFGSVCLFDSSRASRKYKDYLRVWFTGFVLAATTKLVNAGYQVGAWYTLEPRF